MSVILSVIIWRKKATRQKWAKKYIVHMHGFEISIRHVLFLAQNCPFSGTHVIRKIFNSLRSGGNCFAISSSAPLRWNKNYL
jgi:hypothetical protein